MAFENLQPHKEAILAWREEGLTLAQIADRLRADHAVRTTAGTLSRYLKEASPRHSLRQPDPAERQIIDTVSLLTEVLAEIRGRGDEHRMSTEYLAGQIRVLTEVIEEQQRILAERSRPNPGAQASRWGFSHGLVLGVVITAIVAVVFALAFGAGLS